ncbi:hypothetical protein RFN29_25795 [Mesorhizobium sp. VK22B]|uniref:Uncharacterized protein n=1 Tax=Mesorhizobium captivum TaxID=3072319 RepID=A0ABU4Z9L1_9HYPH|nr:hypothetical protein [Mesorhizobium sp. VK22B]MDX8494975.1 hypothetical protein [Mesorhizobium sp. VK22B]
MLPYGVADSAELETLAKVFNDYCKNHRIANEGDREQIAIMVMSLFRRGIEDAEQLSAELERVAKGSQGAGIRKNS